MHPTMFMLTTLAIGTLVLMAGIMMCRESGQSLQCTLKSCLAWGAGYFISMCVQVVVLSNM